MTDPNNDCSCSPQSIQKYMSRISGPLLDRIDLHVDVPAVPFAELSEKPPGEKSDKIRNRVERARRIQSERFRAVDGVYANAHMETKEIKRFCGMNAEGQSLLNSAMEKLGLSARAYDRILKVSRTVSDLAGEPEILSPHLAEAIQYRSLDRQLWL